MTKRDFIMLRVDEETKREIEAAAKARGQSLTTFVLDAAKSAARKDPKKMTATATAGGQHTGVPTYFRASCAEASRGGASGYDAAAWHLCIHLDNEQPYDLSTDEWADRIRELDQMLSKRFSRDEEAIIGWFERHYPKCMELVPARRRETFLRGVYQAWEEGRILL
jgi:hypothetical protein